MKCEVEIIRTKTWIAKIEIENASDENDAEEQALKLVESEKGLPESQQTATWSDEDEFFEVDNSKGIVDDEAEADDEEE